MIERRHLLPLLLLLLSLPAAGCSEARRPRPDPERTKAQPHTPKPGTVTIKSTPAGAAVLSRDNERLGKTPLTLKRPAFTRLDLQLVKDGHRTQQLSVIVEPGEDKEIHARLRLAQGNLLVRTGIIRGARLWVNGEELEKTPCKVEVAAGVKLKVKVERPGFAVHEEEVTVKAGETRQLDVYLVPAGKKALPTGWLTVEANKPAVVTVDGQIMLGPVPVTRVRLPARSYEVQVRPEKGAAKKVKVRIRVDQEEKLRVEL